MKERVSKNNNLREFVTTKKHHLKLKSKRMDAESFTDFPKFSKNTLKSHFTLGSN